ncbi:hypothetical protein LTS18_010243 [Coniosporium uncinatum]|uniref:Uncharacterized protein n=1 Tax=Coniosporium uncinatum TaxID=93489 RepID=A0ACC3D9V2_9PEZI|nr:hypothetical protein LTS18_010243 [Coniosporium uncinatum]
MHEEHPHHLLAQLPLTVSPFLSLPTATTLPYTYKQLPSTLPPSMLDSAPPSNTPSADASSINNNNQPSKPAYVQSTSGHSAHPDDIIASCRALQSHLEKLEREAREMVQGWERDIRERDLAEKRRMAPGWLDVDERSRMLQPERKGEQMGPDGLMGGDAEMDGMEGGAMGREGGLTTQMEGMRLDERGGGSSREGEELDRAFGEM